MKRSLPLLTASSTKTFRACQRIYYYRYVLGMVSVGASRALRFGTVLHLMLEAWWRAVQRGEPEPLSFALEVPRDELSEVDQIRAELLITLYDARWLADAANYEVLEVEAEYRAPLRNPETGAVSRTFQRAGKIDVLVRERDIGRRVLIIEHKTSSEDVSPGSDYWDRLTIDGQISHYYEGAKARGYEADACLYDVIGKPRHEPLKRVEKVRMTKGSEKEPSRPYAGQRLTDETLGEYRARLGAALMESPTTYMRRGEIVRLEDDVRDAAFDDWQIARAIREAELSSRWPRNPEACMRFGRRCDYWGVCTRTASLDDPALFKHERPHRELSHDNEKETPPLAA